MDHNIVKRLLKNINKLIFELKSDINVNINSPSYIIEKQSELDELLYEQKQLIDILYPCK